MTSANAAASPPLPLDPQPVPASRTRSLRSLLIIVGLAALLIRVAFFSEVLLSLPFLRQTFPGNDAHDFNLWAQEIVAGDWLSKARGAPFRGPLCPYLLAAVYVVAGSGNVIAGIVMNGMFGVAAALCAAGLGFSLFGWWAGLAAGLLMALNGPQLSAELLLLGDPVLPAFCLGALWLVVVLLKRERTDEPVPLWRWLLPGILLGFATLGRASNMLVAAALCAAVGAPFLWRRQRRLIGQAVLMGLGVWLVAGPFMLRNGLMYDRWVLQTSGPLVLYVGNAPGTEGIWRYPPGYEEAKKRISEGRGTWVTELRRELKEHPGALRSVLVKKACLFFNSFYAFDNSNYYFIRRYSACLRFGTVGLLPIHVLGFVGLVLTGRAWRKLVPLYVFAASLAVSLIIFHIAGRFKLPFFGVLAVFAGGGASALVEAVRARRWRTPAAACVLAAVFTVAVWPRPPASLKALYQDPTLRPPEFLTHAAILAQDGRRQESIAALEDGMGFFAQDPRFPERLAGLYLKEGRPDLALARTEEALARGLVTRRVLERRVIAYVEMSRLGEARNAARELLERFPESQVGRRTLTGADP